MGLTLFSLATAMLLISRLARTGRSGPRIESSRPPKATLWFLTLTTVLALIAAHAWFRESSLAPALICALTIPFLWAFPGTRHRPSRVAGMILVTLGAACLSGPWWRSGDTAGDDRLIANSPAAPMIIFDDVSRRQELLARARACEVELDLRMMQDTTIEPPASEARVSALKALIEEAKSIIRTLERTEGSSASSALRLSRLEANVWPGAPSPEK